MKKLLSKQIFMFLVIQMENILMLFICLKQDKINKKKKKKKKKKKNTL